MESPVNKSVSQVAAGKLVQQSGSPAESPAIDVQSESVLLQSNQTYAMANESKNVTKTAAVPPEVWKAPMEASRSKNAPPAGARRVPPPVRKSLVSSTIDASQTKRPQDSPPASNRKVPPPIRQAVPPPSAASEKSSSVVDLTCSPPPPATTSSASRMQSTSIAPLPQNHETIDLTGPDSPNQKLETTKRPDTSTPIPRKRSKTAAPTTTSPSPSVVTLHATKRVDLQRGEQDCACCLDKIRSGGSLEDTAAAVVRKSFKGCLQCHHGNGVIVCRRCWNGGYQHNL
jgi:hypothetical protein